LHLLIALYFSPLKFRKTPTQRDTDVVDLFYKKTKVLAVLDPKRFFLEFLYLCKGITNFDLTKFELGQEIYIGASSLFSFTGISFGLSRKILNSTKKRGVDDSAKIFFWYDLLDTIHNYLEGNWDAIRGYSEDLVSKSLSIGEIYDAIQHLYWHGFPYIYQGSFDVAKSIINKLNEIYEVYEHDLSKSLKYELNINLLIERRKLNEALAEVKAGIDFSRKADIYSLLELYSCQAWIHILMGNIEDAEKSLKSADKIRSEVEAPVPFQLSNYYRSKLEYDLYRLNESIRGSNKSEFSELRKRAGKSGKMMQKLTKKVAQHRTESLKLKGVYYWTLNRQGKALMCWRKAIEEGLRLNARLELSRTYMEVGKRLLGPESKNKKFNDIEAQEYIDKAKTLFVEMDLQWDLDELERLDTYTQI